MGEKRTGQDDGYGITDEDRVRIERYLQKEKAGR